MFNLQIPQRLSTKAFQDRRVARYGRLSSVKQGRDPAKDRQIFDLNRAAEAVGPLNSDLLFFDLESGRNDNREGFQAVLKMIEDDKLDALVIINLKRLGRELGTLVDLWNFFGESKCELLIINWGKFVDFSRYSQDYDRFVDDSVVASKESRTIGWRAWRGWEWARHKQKSPYRVPFGFTRDEEGKYTKDPNTEAIASEMCSRFFDSSSPQYHSFRQCQKWLDQEHEIHMAERWAQRWFVHPAIRGDTEYKATGEMIKGTHEGYISYEQFSLVQKTIKNNKRNRGFITNKYPLGGLCYCGVCGNKLFTQNNKKKTLKYLICKGKTYPRKGTEKCTISYNFRYDWVEEMLVNKLCERSEQISQKAATNQSGEINPKIKEIEQNIEKVRRLIEDIGDPSGALSSRIIDMERDIENLSPDESGKIDLEELREFMQYTGSLEFWVDPEMKDEDRRDLYDAIIKQVIVWKDRIEVIWRV